MHVLAQRGDGISDIDFLILAGFIDQHDEPLALRVHVRVLLVTGVRLSKDLPSTSVGGGGDEDLRHGEDVAHSPVGDCPVSSR